MELVTTALQQPINFSWWWLAVPIGIGLLGLLVGLVLRKEAPAGIGAAVLVIGGCLTVLANVSGPTYNEDLLRSDVSEQLQIEETVKDGDWYLGKGPDGEFVRFTLIKEDGAENTYAVLVEK